MEREARLRTTEAAVLEEPLGGMAEHLAMMMEVQGEEQAQSAVGDRVLAQEQKVGVEVGVGVVRSP
jgi:hypothetical protein